MVHVVPSLEEYRRYGHLTGPLVQELSAAGRAILDEARVAIESEGFEANLRLQVAVELDVLPPESELGRDQGNR